jgi:glycosyltransferase involved in cell wall biosynthesis
MTEAVRVAYVLTHYPKLSQTFLQREIAAVEAEGLAVDPIALNPPDPIDVADELGRRESARTTYVKTTSKLTLAALVGRTALRRPGPFVAGLVAAVRPAGLDLRGALWRAFQYVEALVVWDRCRRTGVRHLHAQFGGVPATVAMLAADLGNRLGHDERWTWSFTIHGFQDFVNERETGLAAKAASAAAVVGISDYTRSQVLRIADPADWPKVCVVRCGIDLAAFSQRPPRPVGDPPVLVTVGRLSAEKGHGVLLEAARLLVDRGRPVRVVFIGGGDADGSIRREVTRLGLGDTVELVGELPPAEVGARLRAADVFCLPSFAEGLPVSIMEAMAVGVPVVSTYISGIPELVTNGVSGWCVPAGRADELADAIGRAVVDDAGRAALVAEARRRVEADHDLFVNARAMVDLLGPLARR